MAPFGGHLPRFLVRGVAKRSAIGFLNKLNHMRIYLSDRWIFNKNARGQKGAD
jgi:hypothetical protein